MAIAAPGISLNTCLRRDLSRRRSPLPRVSCRRQISDADDHTDARLLHLRGVLIALGGLCSTAAGPMALAKPASTTGGIVRERYIDSNPLFVSTGGDATGELATSSSSLVRVGEFGTQPRKLEAATPLRVLVARPKKDRTEAEKAEEVEVLEISGIKVDADHPARFDVYIAAGAGGVRGDVLEGAVAVPAGKQREGEQEAGSELGVEGHQSGERGEAGSESGSGHRGGDCGRHCD